MRVTTPRHRRWLCGRNRKHWRRGSWRNRGIGII